MVKLYLVRHGECSTDVDHIQLGDAAPLTHRGILQSHSLADAFRNISIDAIVSSPIVRAIDTARVIADALSVQVQVDPLLRERRRPSSQLNINTKSTAYEIIDAQMREALVNNERVFDEETFGEVGERATQLLERFRSLGAANILAVGHGTFIKIIIAQVLSRGRLDGRQCRDILNAVTLNNASVSVLEYSVERGLWRLVGWNHDPVKALR